MFCKPCATSVGVKMEQQEIQVRTALWMRSVAVGLGALLAVAVASPDAVRAAQSASPPAAANAASNAAAASEAETFVQTSIDAGFAILNNKQLDAREREKRFREFLFSLVDTKRIAAFTLGPYVRGASSGDMDKFLAAYDNFVAALFQGYFDWYKGEALRVSSSTARSADDVVVSADIVAPNGGRKFRTAFRVRLDSAGRKVVTDFQFEGAWFALSQRADFTAYMQRHDGDFAGLTAELDKRTQRFQKDWAPPAGG
jgi:phospholipid transport system substrate-binding protein